MIWALLSDSGQKWLEGIDPTPRLRTRSFPGEVYLTNERKLAPSSILIAVSALRFLYKVTLHKKWAFEDMIPAPKKPQTLPVVLSPEEVLRFLDCTPGLKHRTILTTCYAAGLRISEAVRLRPTDIDSSRMVIRVEQGTGQNAEHF